MIHGVSVVTPFPVAGSRWQVSLNMSEDAKLFVGSLSWNTTDETLSQAFQAFGDVAEARASTPSARTRPRLCPAVPHARVHGLLEDA